MCVEFRNVRIKYGFVQIFASCGRCGGCRPHPLSVYVNICYGLSECLSCWIWFRHNVRGNKSQTWLGHDTKFATPPWPHPFEKCLFTVRGVKPTCLFYYLFIYIFIFLFNFLNHRSGISLGLTITHSLVSVRGKDCLVLCLNWYVAKRRVIVWNPVVW